MKPELKNLLTKECVSIGEDSLSEKDLLELLEALGSGKYKPRVLDLSGNVLTTAVLEKLPLILDACPTLVYLDLSDCGLTKEHESALGKLSLSLQKHPGLLAVDFSDNDLSLLNLSHLINVLRKNSQLLQMQFSGNQQFNATLGNQVVDVLKDNHSLLSLLYNSTTLKRTAGSPDSDKANREIYQFLQENREAFLAQPTSTLNIPQVVIDFLEKNKLTHDVLLELHPLLFIKQQKTEPQKRELPKKKGIPDALLFSLRPRALNGQATTAHSAAKKKQKIELN